MLFGHSVDVVTQRQGQVGRVQPFLVADGIMNAASFPRAHDLVDQIEWKLVVAGRHGRVRREDASSSHCVEVRCLDEVPASLLSLFSQYFQCE